MDDVCRYLVIFNFMTGDHQNPCWSEIAMVKGSDADIDELGDNISSYCEYARDYFDDGYSDALEEILDASSLEYTPITWKHSGEIPACDRITIIYI